MPLRRILVSLVIAIGGSLTAAPHATAGTLHVASDGDDTASGTAEAPLRTIDRARQLARRGDVVLVGPGRYEEQVTLDWRTSGVTFRGHGGRPVIDGQGRRAHGFYSNIMAVSDVTIENFEITGQLESGISMVGTHLRIEDNVVHHVGQGGGLHSWGIRLLYGERHRVAGNSIYSVGPGGESLGVLLVQTRDAEVASNIIYLIRKEGVRDYMGLDNSIVDNRIFLTWTAVAPNYSTGTYAANNYLHDNVQGFNPKHTSDARTLKHWGLEDPRWVRFWHNTVLRSSSASVALAISGDKADHLDIRNNVLASAGGTYIADAPDRRGPNVVVDGNVYDTGGVQPPWLYHVGYNWHESGHRDLAGLRAALGWEQRGRAVDLGAQVGPVTEHGIDLPLVGIPLPDTRGSQVGARGLEPAPVRWTAFAMKPVASSSPGSWWTRKHLTSTADGAHHTYWMTDTASDEFVTFDLGEPRSFQHIVMEVFSHRDLRLVRRYRFEASDDGEKFRTILEGENPDPYHSSYKYELRVPVTARYFRMVLVDTFCASYDPRSNCGGNFIVSEVRVGRLDPATADSAPLLPDAAPAPQAPEAGTSAAPEGAAVPAEAPGTDRPDPAVPAPPIASAPTATGAQHPIAPLPAAAPAAPPPVPTPTSNAAPVPEPVPAGVPDAPSAPPPPRSPEPSLAAEVRPGKRMAAARVMLTRRNPADGALRVRVVCPRGVGRTCGGTVRVVQLEREAGTRSRRVVAVRQVRLRPGTERILTLRPSRGRPRAG